MGYTQAKCSICYVELNQAFWNVEMAKMLFGNGQNNICNYCNDKILFTEKYPAIEEKLHWFYLKNAVGQGYGIKNKNNLSLEVTLYGYPI